MPSMPNPFDIKQVLAQDCSPLEIGLCRRGPGSRAATDYFREAAAWGTHKRVLDIGLLSFVTLLHREPTKTSSQPALQMTHAVNPGNEGAVKLSSETPPHLVR
jgi:hypothetical protein